jgi:radical SAM protein with 4Fe4S-binding SPASM domain
LKSRIEHFGAIVELPSPLPGLAWVDRERARSLGLEGGEAWQGEAPSHLSGPTEVHLVLSRRCDVGCRGCYVDATPRGDQMLVEEARRVIDALAQQGVFHVAMGGGETLHHEDLFEMAAYARSRDIVPNLTTSGVGMTEALAERCRVFGQINVSVDAVGKNRGTLSFGEAERALRLLRAVKKEVGINCVVSRSSYDGIGDVVRFAKQLRLSEVELLRFKPAGRGASLFARENLLPSQGRGIYRRALWLAFRHRIRVKLDCSFAPMIFAHRPSRRAAEFLGVVGCEGGNILASVMPDGQVVGCSFGGPNEGSVLEPGHLPAMWKAGFGAFRDYRMNAAEPCRSCEYLQLCKGGCRVVAQAAGDWSAPDPGCPKVQDYQAREAAAGRRARRTLSVFPPSGT